MGRYRKGGGPAAGRWRGTGMAIGGGSEEGRQRKQQTGRKRQEPAPYPPAPPAVGCSRRMLTFKPYEAKGCRATES